MPPSENEWSSVQNHNIPGESYTRDLALSLNTLRVRARGLVVVAEKQPKCRRQSLADRSVVNSCWRGRDAALDTAPQHRMRKAAGARSSRAHPPGVPMVQTRSGRAGWNSPVRIANLPLRESGVSKWSDARELSPFDRHSRMRARGRFLLEQCSRVFQDRTITRLL
jgi:hypothetical protein